MRDSKGKKEKPKELDFRPLPSVVNEVVEKSLSNENPFNFGLYFNKWLKAVKSTATGHIKYQFQTKPETVLSSGGGHHQADESVGYYRKIKPFLFEILKRKIEERDGICEAFKRIGYECYRYRAKLLSPLIVGLGNSNPTERGFTFHWTMGIPYIPAEGVKGVLRLAYLVNKATEDENFFSHWADEDATYWESLKDLFGAGVESSQGTGAKKGKVIFMDALPADVPELGIEITNCHYREYYGGERGPTEDQQPVPIPFLAVMPGSVFDFIFLLKKELSSEMKENFEKAFEKAISEHGFGGKTSTGHGRFGV
ncbi:MAG: type III-B CRISPR module RAMP protein Cmr6 [Thermodesulforhabdaceae bacterium]